jgi:hypothetical protein
MRLLNRAKFLWAVAALALSACIPDSINPLGDPARATPDSRLVGRWTGTMNEQRAALAVTAGEGTALRFRVETTDQEGKTEWVVLDGLPAVAKKQTYMNVKFREEENKVYDPATENYYILRYAVSKDGLGLDVWAMAEAMVVDAIAGGRINGMADPAGAVRNVHITDSTVAVRDFVENSNPERVFGEKFASFRRAAD